MDTPQTYEHVLASAKTLSPEELSRLIEALSRLLDEKYSSWTTLSGEEEVREYLEWTRLRDSHHDDGRTKSPEEFLAEIEEGD